MHRREIIGTAVSITDYDEVLEEVDRAIESDRHIYICCAPASTLVFARDDRALAAALNEADIVTPDGMGVVHAARILGESIGGRVYGPDLMAAQLARAGGHPNFLYGGHDEDALSKLEAALSQQFPDAPIAGSWSPPHRELTAAETDSVVAMINASGAKIVWVGIGSPKQELWMQSLRGRLEASVLIGVGAAFDFFAGRVSQAPKWMQRAGLEWLFRILQDPLRLGKRYLLTLPRFGALVLSQHRHERRLR